VIETVPLLRVPVAMGVGLPRAPILVLSKMEMTPVAVEGVTRTLKVAS